MDALTSLLAHVRATGALLGKNILSRPWAIRFEEDASLSLVTMLRGEGWIITNDPANSRPGPPLHLTTGDLALLSGSASFTITSEPDTDIPPLYVLQDPTTCTDGAGRIIDEGELSLGIRTCGARLDGEHALLTGTYRAYGTAAERILSALPSVLVIPAAEQPAPLALIEAEITRDQPGQQAVLDRLLDLLLVATLRGWFSRPEATAPAWYRAMTDTIVGASLRAMHDDPAAPWTVETLALEARVSRATLARQFTKLLGESPIAYLTSWRLCLAADLLRDNDSTVETIAHQVGYSNAYALSTAFTRKFGRRPTEHRRLSQAA